MLISSILAVMWWFGLELVHASICQLRLEKVGATGGAVENRQDTPGEV